MKKLSAAVLVVFALAVMMGLAQSQSLQITGTAGYLSEFELSGTVTESTSSGRTEFFGPLLWKLSGYAALTVRKKNAATSSLRCPERVLYLKSTRPYRSRKCNVDIKDRFPALPVGEWTAREHRAFHFRFGSHWPKTP